MIKPYWGTAKKSLRFKISCLCLFTNDFIRNMQSWRENSEVENVPLQIHERNVPGGGEGGGGGVDRQLTGWQARLTGQTGDTNSLASLLLLGHL
jgi:hypothetical protein